jgi:hypothetical protein
MKLDKKDTAIIFKPGGAVEVALPEFNEEALVSDEMLFATAIVFLLQSKDKDFLKIINDKIENMIKETKEDV